MSQPKTTKLALLLIGLGLTQAFSPQRHAIRDGLTRLHFEDEKMKVEAAPVKDGKESETAPLSEAEKAKKTVDELTRTRPYPLFVTEKVVGTVERTAKSLGKSFNRLSQPDDQDDAPIAKKKPREKVVCLGVGWASAAFLADIDTNLYDVTVISPRNHFVFTPSK